MADRPIVWALGVAGAAMMATLWLTPRLTSMTVTESGTRPVGAARAELKPAVPAGPAVLEVSADYRGHFVVHPTIDNVRVRMLVDTGASVVALTSGDAVSLDLKQGAAGRDVRMSTANGTVTARRVTIREMKLGTILMRDVEAVVMPPGALSVSLLGTSFLRRLRSYGVESGRMVLRG